ncbi:hypothetical protein U9M48_008474 [Paspalum notatum var. saurae]|uniref:Transposase-associated domain-containing protein n=1 Tax=Paspalum notatum var. saurae TaxID=547442 RepID=A0AAQ3SQ53_PASNO
MASKKSKTGGKSRVDPSYLIEVDKFIETANKHATKTNSVGIICPCRICKNKMVAREDKTVRSHLICHGFVKHYHTCIYHGEEKITYKFISDDEDMDEEIFLVAHANYVDAVENNEGVEHNEGVFEIIPAGSSGDLGDDCDQDADDLEEMLKHFEADVIHKHAKGLEHFEPVKDAAKQSVYDKSKGCLAHWSQLRFEECPTCGASRYKNNEVFTGQDDQGPGIRKKRKKGSRKNVVPPEEEVQTCLGIEDNQRKIPALVMWYLNPIDRLRRLFANPREAKLMRWWHEERAKELAHPADGTQWKRNVRFALSTDGMNPFGDRSSTHSTWPVILTIYNLPTWLCQKWKYLLLCILIQGPKQPGFEIDVFLEPLMKDMTKLWNEGFKIWDEFGKEEFTLRGIIIITINDYPALFSLCGQIKGKTGCLVCLDGTSFLYLDGSRKIVYTKYRPFILEGHRYCRKKFYKCFNGKAEPEFAPT